RRTQARESQIDRDRLLTLRVAASADRYTAPAARRDLYDRLRDRIGAVAGVTAVSFTNTLGLAAPPAQIEREGQRPSAPSDAPTAATMAVDAGYFRALGLAV